MTQNTCHFIITYSNIASNINTPDVSCVKLWSRRTCHVCIQYWCIQAYHYHVSHSGRDLFGYLHVLIELILPIVLKCADSLVLYILSTAFTATTYVKKTLWCNIIPGLWTRLKWIRADCWAQLSHSLCLDYVYQHVYPMYKKESVWYLNDSCCRC